MILSYYYFKLAYFGQASSSQTEKENEGVEKNFFFFWCRVSKEENKKNAQNNNSNSSRSNCFATPRIQSSSKELKAQRSESCIFICVDMVW